ncbi:MAG TPA: YcnI family protein [Gemmatimonadaceae bacterium]|jgi:uncharacterized protein YcnI|nr:YcnI family protein [Gemmatimonadaceae bacterium]
MKNWLAALAACVGLTLVTWGIAFGHAVVFPKTSTPGAFERYVLRVPNEKSSATTRVEIRFPADVRVTSFEDVPGWQLEVLTDSAKRVVGAVWTGTLPPQRFVEFPFMAANPKAETQIVWPAYQTYADGQRVEWTGAEGTRQPASVTTIAAAGATSSGGSARWLPWLALVAALLSLGLTLRKSEPKEARLDI